MEQSDLSWVFEARRIAHSLISDEEWETVRQSFDAASTEDEANRAYDEAVRTLERNHFPEARRRLGK